MRKLNKETGEMELMETPFLTVSQPGPFWKTPFNHDRDAESLSTALACKDPSLTQQSFAKEADINNILAKFRETGILPVTGEPKYLDIEAEFDLQDKMVTAHQVEEAWNKLPKEARAILRDPAKFVEWYDHCLETGNVDGLRDIGLIPPEKAQEPPKEPPGGTPAPEGAKAPPAPAGGDTSASK